MILNRFIVAVWDCDREDGGPEEGGWSYETGTLELSVETNKKRHAKAIRELLEEAFPYTGQRGMFSKRGPDYSVVIIDRLEEFDLERFDSSGALIDYYPTTRPHYE